ncbi:hypothetical protein OX283_004830 [Flavobacterium sp. SUN052]|uniref:hypothetical protein n=1 Tax=Flavobacterium sp. SUN052 TaxID=3002441 RepID=UPI00237E19F6|nr:hypothetical protein [Flavobacterium sp. SUN052]MEC4003971.1 hypothetical protein [Flavobacterium sp. SUN052]
MKKILIIKLRVIKSCIYRKQNRVLFLGGHLFTETTTYLLGFKIDVKQSVKEATLVIH